MLNKILCKLRKEGLTGALKAAGRKAHHKIHQPDVDFKALPSLLEKTAREKPTVTIVQIGSNVGNTDNDPLYGFLRKHCLEAKVTEPVRCRALLVEPVRHLFEQLKANYANFRGVVCENAAVAEATGTRNFYRLQEGIDLQAHGLPAWSEQLGSFLPEQMTSLWSREPENKALREFVEAHTVVEKVPCLTVGDLLAKHQLTNVDLLQIDTEGYDYQILRTINFQQFKPRWINYERIHLKKDESRCRALLLDHGYRLHDHGQDTLCELTSVQSSIKRWRERVYCAWLDSIY